MIPYTPCMALSKDVFSKQTTRAHGDCNDGKFYSGSGGVIYTFLHAVPCLGSVISAVDTCVCEGRYVGGLVQGLGKLQAGIPAPLEHLPAFRPLITRPCHTMDIPRTSTCVSRKENI